MRRLLFVPLAVALLLLGAGCDWSKPGGKEVSPTPDTVVGTVPTQSTETSLPPQFAKGDPAAGKAVFASAGCVGCHTLKAANAAGKVGPNLDEAQPNIQLIVNRVTNGRGGMPSFKGQLTDKQIADVAAFVFDSTHGSDGG